MVFTEASLTAVDIARMYRYAGHALCLSIPEIQVTTFLMMLKEPCFSESCNDLAGPEVGQAAHTGVPASTRTTAVTSASRCSSWGIGCPALTSASRKPVMAS